MKSTTTNHEGETHVLPVNARTRLTIRATHAFNVETSKGDGQDYCIVAPDNDTSRYAQIELAPNTSVLISTLGRLTLVNVPLVSRNETPSPDSLCEVVHEQKLSMYDRLKVEMFQALSVYAEEKGLDTFDDDDDHSFVEEDNLIDTPYEHIAMQDDFLVEDPLPEPIPQPLETPTEPLEPITPIEPPLAS